MKSNLIANKKASKNASILENEMSNMLMNDFTVQLERKDE